MTGLVVGLGEVGSALLRVLSAASPTTGYDAREPGPIGAADILHIAFPWQEGFVDKVRGYQVATGARLIVIHSTVPVGTTRQLGETACHSPVHGVHPHLDHALRTFVKPVGAVDPHAGHAVALYLAKAGIRARLVDGPETSELSKLLATTFYGLSILMAKEASRLCREHGASFAGAYTAMLEQYNQGYRNLGMGHVAQPILEPVPGPVNGHCITPNAALLGGRLGQTFLDWNESFRGEA